MNDNRIAIPIEIRDGGVYALMPDGTEQYLGSCEKAVRVACGEFND